MHSDLLRSPTFVSCRPRERARAYDTQPRHVGRRRDDRSVENFRFVFPSTGLARALFPFFTRSSRLRDERTSVRELAPLTRIIIRSRTEPYNFGECTREKSIAFSFFLSSQLRDYLKLLYAEATLSRDARAMFFDSSWDAFSIRVNVLSFIYLFSLEPGRTLSRILGGILTRYFYMGRYIARDRLTIRLRNFSVFPLTNAGRSLLPIYEPDRGNFFKRRSRFVRVL